MIVTSENNYFQWFYEDELFARKPFEDSKLKIKYNAKVENFGSFKEELINNANKIIDLYPNRKFSILLSGGSESETMIRLYRSQNIDFTAYIFRYEKDINLYDVSYAISAAESIGATYKVIDFNLTQFYESGDAEKISEIAQIDRPRALPQLKFLDYITDNSVVLGGQGATAWRRPGDIDYTIKSIWVDVYDEFEIGWDRYVKETKREACLTWLRYSPQLVLAHNSTDWAKKLRSDSIIGKTGVKSTKLQGYQEVFPEMLQRIKKHGMEPADDLINEYQEFLIKKYNGLPFRGYAEKTWNEICQELLGKQASYQ